MGRPGQWWIQQSRNRQVAYTLLFVLAFTLIGSAIAFMGRSQLPYRTGQTVTDPILSRVRFESIDTKSTQENRKSAFEREPAVYRTNVPYFMTLRQKLVELVVELASTDIEHLALDVRQKLKIDAAALTALQQYIEGDRPSTQWQQIVDSFVADIMTVAVLDRERAEAEGKNQADRAWRIRIVLPVDHPDAQHELLRTDKLLLNVAEDPLPIQAKLKYWAKHRKIPRPIQATIVATVMEDLQPFHLFDEEETQRRRLAASEQEPIVKRVFEPNTVLVNVGTGKAEKFSDLDIKLIEQERNQYWKDLTTLNQLLSNVAIVGLVMLIAIGCWLYFWAYYPRIIANAMRGTAIQGLLLGCQAAAVGLNHLPFEFAYAGAVFPTLTASIILAIAYDQRLALTVGSLHALLVTFTLNLPLGFGLVLLVGVVASVSQLRQVRHRSTLVQVGLWTGIAMAIMVVLAGASSRPMHIDGEITRMLRDALLAMATCFVAGLFAQGILPAIESIFKVSTAMTLKDLNDSSLPLLRRLAELAPGTYQHSLQLADLGESAADAIGTDGLLCRVGAMYHDIGKVNKPMYFVENQGAGPNRHDKLSPAMSVLIIVGHVKDGIEMAREYRLPSAIRHFIESHHGTTLVEYFYHEARKQKEKNPDTDQPVPSEFEFRYPGPKPQTKEAAIIMLCDGIESAARTIADPTPVRLEQLVHQMATKRLMDGQFEECHLTLKELQQIETAVTKTLCAIYHSRVAYPKTKSRESQEDASDNHQPGTKAVS